MLPRHVDHLARPWSTSSSSARARTISTSIRPTRRLVDRSKVGNPPEWYKDTGTGVSYIDKTNYMPNIAFGGRTGNTLVQAAFGNIPYENFNNIYSLVDNLSWS